MIATIIGVVIDCPDPGELAPFYETLLGARRMREDPDWITLDAGPLTLSLQRTRHFVAPDWRRGDPPQQLHLDLTVTDLDVGERQVIALGGSVLESSDKPIGYRVFADPVGHPFCLVTPEGMAEYVP
ncbi:VOC family protein [Jiangella endophytica]|uniref:VOC family protein n=1 Tax=Jiangella endophytica TaxID=1623398 RepID=UPI000E3561A9|nr:VOC family protein [Jiangella endophytica]